jgi:hypothetical protein
VIDPKKGSDEKAVWHEVGAIWPHKNGGGFDPVIPTGLKHRRPGRLRRLKPQPDRHRWSEAFV